MPKYQRALCWIRRDLRITDHAALSAATSSSEKVAVVFVFDQNILGELKDITDRRLTFIHRSLKEVDAALRSHGSRLIVLHGDPVQEIPRLAKQLEAEAVFTARDYDPYAVARDRAVGEQLNLVTVKDIVVKEPAEILTQAGLPFRVFTPYSRAWRESFRREDVEEKVSELENLWPAKQLPNEEPWPLERFGFQESDLWLQAGESGGTEALANFENRIAKYGATRDFPAEDGVSYLGVHFRFGTISIRAAMRMALENESAGATKWQSELIWREFYQHILAHNPEVVRQPFQPQFRDVSYPGPPHLTADEAFCAWCEGRTGYPIVDAAMRCINATGYMHNRLRMVVASFLTKDLLLDYRWGEEYFSRLLLDFELASNNGGWQWSASVGADPQPYFRIFNPILQSKKFDPDGAFIRRWVPELRELQGEAIHFPASQTDFDLLACGVELGKTYPRSMVDHAEMRVLATQMLESYAKAAR